MDMENESLTHQKNPPSSGSQNTFCELEPHFASQFGEGKYARVQIEARRTEKEMKRQSRPATSLTSLKGWVRRKGPLGSYVEYRGQVSLAVL